MRTSQDLAIHPRHYRQDPQRMRRSSTRRRSTTRSQHRRNQVRTRRTRRPVYISLLPSLLPPLLPLQQPSLSLQSEVQIFTPQSIPPTLPASLVKRAPEPQTAQPANPPLPSEADHNPWAEDEDFWWALTLGYNPENSASEYSDDDDDDDYNIKRRYFMNFDEGENCSICLESFTDGDIIGTTPCTHRFHNNCLENWMAEHPNCPVCRHDFEEHYSD